MKHKSNVAAGEFLIIALSGIAFHFYSLMWHSSLWREEKSQQQQTTPKVRGNNIKCNLMTFFMGDRVERK